MENEVKESAGVTRSQNAMYVLPHDASAAQGFVAPLLQRVAAAEAALQLLVITTDVEAAAALAGTVVRSGGPDLRVVPVAGARRAERRIREGAHVVIGSATELLGLVKAAALKLDTLRAVCIAWADELSAADLEAVEALFGEIPKTAARVIVATEATDAVEELVERHARRPRRDTGRPQDAAAPVDVGFVAAAASGRPAALRRTIDALDPGSARVVVRGDDSERAARHALEAMGYRGADSAVAVVHADAVPEDGVDLAILYDLPHSPAQLAAAATNAGRTIALVQPRQIASLRKLAGGGSVAPVSLPDVASRGAAEVAALRQALASELAAGGIGRELLVLEPLLEEHDPMELAAAALRLATRTQGGAGQVRGASAGSAAAATGPMTRVFINVGEMDNARPGDLVGAIINEGGVQRDQVGRIELRDKHAVVEVASDAAEQVIERLSGTSIRGRRVQARVDQERPARERGDRAERGQRGERSERPARPARPARGREGDERPRSRSFDRERPPRERSFDRERPTRERSFDRERPARERSFDRERPARGPRAAGGARDREGGFGGRQGGPRGPSRPTRPRRDDT